MSVSPEQAPEPARKESLAQSNGTPELEQQSASPFQQARGEERWQPLPQQSPRGPEQRRLVKQVSSVGYLCRQLPPYVQQPPIEAVIFGWGVNEDGQLVRAFSSLLFAALCCQMLCHQRVQQRRWLQWKPCWCDTSDMHEDTTATPLDANPIMICAAGAGLGHRRGRDGAQGCRGPAGHPLPRQGLPEGAAGESG